MQVVLSPGQFIHRPCQTGTASSAAMVGVRVCMSADRSAKLWSVSWPTAAIIGVVVLAMARTTGSSAESPQVLQAAATAANNDQVNQGVLTGLFDGVHD